MQGYGAENSKKFGAAMLSVVSNTTLVVFKLVIALLTGSFSIFSEAIHSGMDLLAAIIAFFSIRKASEPADAGHPYGHGKFENIAALFEAILIFLAAFYIIYEAVVKLLDPHPIERLGLGLAVMGLSAVVNFFVSRYLFKVAKDTSSIALDADAWHLRTDVYTSVGLFIGLILIWITGWIWLDPVFAIMVALLILKAAFDLTVKASQDIIDSRLPPEEERHIADVLERYKTSYRDYHELRSRKSGNMRFVDLHVVVPGEMEVAKAHQLCHSIEDEIRVLLPNTTVVVHFEPSGESEE